MAKKPGFSAETDQALPPGTPGDETSRSVGTKTGFLSGRPSLARRLATTYLLTTLLVLIVLSVVVYFSASFYLDRRLETELDTQANFYAAYAASLAADERALSSLAPTVASLFAPQADLTVRFFAASNGALLAATQDIGPEPSRAALRELRYHSPTMFTPSSRDLPHRRYAARQIVVGDSAQDERVVGVVEVSKSTTPGEEFLVTLRTILLAAVLVAASISLLVSVLLARRLSGPVRQMERATRRIAAGDLDVRLGDCVAGNRPADEVGRLAQSIDHMAARLKHLESARAQFIGEVSHDLRTPLAAIKGLLVNLIDAAGPDERSLLEIAERETDRLIRLVNQLLDFSRWQGGQLKLDRQVVDVGAVAREAVALYDGRARHRNVALRAEIPSGLPPVSADADRLQRVILNLLDNAIGFTPAGGDVVLRVEAVGQSDTETRGQGEEDISISLPPCLLVSVRDTGRGMSEEEQAQAFEPYYRGEGGGAGLGLTIARAIVEAHGGQMGVESTPGQGSRVWFTLPL